MNKWVKLSNSEILKEQMNLRNEYDELKNMLIIEQDKLKNIQERVEQTIKDGILKLKSLDDEFKKSNDVLKNRKYGR